MASGCSTSDNHGDRSGSSTPKFEEENLRPGARRDDRATTSMCKKINDSVYELYMPPTQNAEIDIVFIHGLHIEGISVPHLSTWRSRCAERLIWPKYWLPEDFPAARVLTTTYDASLQKDDKYGRMDLYLVAESLLQDLLLAKVGQTCSVILVGHSFGGLVIKKLICLLDRSRRYERSRKFTFLQNIRGIFFYATPHQGFRSRLVAKFKDEGELVAMVRVLNKDLARLNQDFQDLCEELKWNTAGVIESQSVDMGGGLSDVIVEEASARYENIIAVQEDHFSICQPCSKQSSTYHYLVSLVGDVQLKVTEELRSTSLPGDFQILPTIQAGPLSSLAGGEILETLERFSVVGLWGMGGIGKTTLSKAAFNNLHVKFEYTLYVENVKEILGDAKKLREELLQQMHRKGRKMEKIPDRTTLGGKDLLVVLDDVEKDRDIAIVHELQVICSLNSCFILTSRDREILSKVDHISILEVNPLNGKESERLFRSFAFPYYGPWLPWQQRCSEHMAPNIVQACQGLPLILEIVGKYLSTSEENVWSQTLNKLRAVDDAGVDCVDKVWSKLKVSYHGLRDEEKQMFIDAATFFQEESPIRWKLFQAKAVWNAAFTSEAVYWKTLVDRSLVYDVAEDSEIKMHEQLKNLAQTLAKDLTETRTRIKIIDEDSRSFSKALQEKNLQVEKLHTIQLLISSETAKISCFRCTLLLKAHCRDEHEYGYPLCLHSFPRISVARLEAMENLHYLQLANCTLAGRKVIVPRNLLFLHSIGPGENISFRLCSKLMYLIMESSGIKRLRDSFRNLHNLKFLYLESRDLKCLPDLFSSLKRLHGCTLSCPSLKDLPVSIGDLENLQQFAIKCKSLKRFPESFGKLGNLRELKIEWTKLKTLPESFGKLGNLRELKIERTKLKTLPESFGKLGNLRDLTVETEQLESLPESFGGLGNLLELRIDTVKLEKLPESFGNLGNLQYLKIWSDKLERLPESFGNLGNLRYLRILSQKHEIFSDSFGNLGNLRDLMIETPELERLPESFTNLGNLQYLSILTGKLESLPESFGNLRGLQRLRIITEKLDRLPQSFGMLGSLRGLEICSDKLETLPESFGSLGNLRKLHVSASKLERLPESFCNLGNLQKLEISQSKLESLPECLGSLGNLKEWKIWSDKLERLLES